MGKRVKKVKIKIEYHDDLELSELAAFEDVLEEVLDSLENREEDIKVKVKFSDDTESVYKLHEEEEDEDIEGGEDDEDDEDDDHKGLDLDSLFE